VDPRAGLDDFEKRKFLTLPGLELRPLSRPPVASRYTDYDTPAPLTKGDEQKMRIFGRKVLRKISGPTREKEG
jgi:hypothetical protein